MADTQLASADRDFFALVSRASFSNPFGAERDALDRRIAGADLGGEALLEGVLERTRARLAGLAKGGAIPLARYGEADREVLEHALHFVSFHRHAAPFDRLIEREAQGAEPGAVPFARELLGELAAHGTTLLAPAHVMALFFQMRRAFYFIDRQLVGRGPSMRRLRESLWNNVFTYDLRLYASELWERMEDFSTLLLGATGSGKGAAATAIGRSGYIGFDERRLEFRERFTESFVEVSLAELSPQLLESELFGHEKGAFTGAIQKHRGLLSRSHRHGAVFLDEIGEVTPPMQVKLLRVLQDRTFTPVGGHAPERFSGRVIAATHRSLERMRAEGQLRDDLYYRLCSDVIHVPPLAVRLEEDPAELDDLLAALVPEIVPGAAPHLVGEVAHAVRRDMGPGYGWPGNVRELEQATRRVLLTGRCAPDLAEAPGEVKPFLEGIAAGAYDAHALLRAYCAHLYAREGTYEAVARITSLDRRTVKKYVEGAAAD